MEHEKNFVLDCSATMAWIFPDETSTYCKKVQQLLLESQAHVPTIWPLEVANVLWAAERSKRITESQSLRFRRILEELPIHIDTETSNRVFGNILAIAREQDITVYDASYLELSMYKAMPLATLDKALKKAAKKVGVSLV